MQATKEELKVFKTEGKKYTIGEYVNFSDCYNNIYHSRWGEIISIDEKNDTVTVKCLDKRLELEKAEN